MKLCVTLFLAFYFSLGAYCQLRNLVFEGAGVRGLAYSGAIVELENRGHIKGIESVGGTSAGAIAALTLALGYTGKEIQDITGNLKLQKFNDGRFFFIGGIARMNRYYGWYRGKAFERWLGEIIEKKTGDPNITFEQLHDQGFKDLYVTGTNLSAQRLVIFSHHNYPSMKVRDAVRISMSIPLYFQAVCIDSVGKVVNCKTGRGSDLYVDGGLTGNFPIHMFDSIASDGRRICNRGTVGFRIDTPEQIASDRAGNGMATYTIVSFKNYAASFYSYVIEHLNRSGIDADDWARTVSISSGKIGPKIRKLSAAEKDFLFNSGKTAVSEYIDKK